LPRLLHQARIAGTPFAAWVWSITYDGGGEVADKVVINYGGSAQIDATGWAPSS